MPQTEVKTWRFDTPDALAAFASRLAPHVSPRDFIGLYGDLGAGKTVFAQGLLSALGVAEEVTSPTYGIVHEHASGARRIFHCDFYRLEPGQRDEIGLSEMIETGVVVAEWPNAIDIRPHDRLEVHIALEGETRVVKLSGFGSWEAKTARFAEGDEFLAAHGYDKDRCIAVRGDASTRTFARLSHDGGTVFFMDWPVNDDGPPVWNGQPYCAVAHLARTGQPFLALSRWLREKAAVSTPDVFAADVAAGLYLIEDLGDRVFGELIAKGAPLRDLYRLAVDGLLAIKRGRPTRDGFHDGNEPYALPRFDRSALEIELSLILDWYAPMAWPGRPATGLRESFAGAWAPSLDWLDTQDRSLVLRDYHSPNLLLRPEFEGMARLGLVDFQDAVWGHPAYDLVSLLQDARLTVSPEDERALFRHYCDRAAEDDAAFDLAGFEKAYAILGAQRNTKILGIFARLAERDGKDGYLAHIPRVSAYLRRDLAHPALKPLKAWYDEHLFDGFAGARTGRSPLTSEARP